MSKINSKVKFISLVKKMQDRNSDKKRLEETYLFLLDECDEMNSHTVGRKALARIINNILNHIFRDFIVEALRLVFCAIPGAPISPCFDLV